MPTTGNDIEGRFIAAVIKDDTDERRQECVHLSADVFEDYSHRMVWKAVRSARDYLSAFEEARCYLAHETIGERYAADRDALILRQIESIGLRHVSEWIHLIPSPHRGMPCPTTAASLCQNPPVVPPEIIHGILYGRGTMMLSGPSKARKTYSFLDLGLSVATGTPWIGFETTQTPVIYLNFELADHSLQKRIAAICAAKNISPPENLHIFNLRGCEVNVALLSKELPRAINERAAGLVIVDPWYKISANSGAEENSNDGQARILSQVERLTNTSGAAVVLGHHFAKGDASAKNAIDRAAGAGAMARWGDVIATLTEHEDPDAMTLEFFLRDFPPVGKIAVRWQLPIWMRAPELDPAKLKKAGRVDEHPASGLVKLLSDGMTNQQWFGVAKEKKWADTTFRRKRDELIAAKKVQLVGACYYHVAA